MATIVIAGLFILSLITALFFPITEGDGIWYEVRGRLLFHEHHFDLQVFHDTYSPFVHLLYAYLYSIDFERVKIIFPLVYLCLLVIFYHRVYAYHKNPKLASIFTLILATTPYFWWHSVLPFLNLVSGFYFSVASIYWFFLIRQLLENPLDGFSPGLTSFALLSGFFFGMASWTRMEFLVYGAVPLAGLVYVVEQKPRFDRSQKNKILLPFSGLMLGIPSAWFLTLLSFKIFLGLFLGALLAVCALSWIFILAVALGKVKVKMSRKSLLPLIVSASLGFIIIIALRFDSLSTSLWLGVFRTLFFNGFYLCTAGLALFLFTGGLKGLNIPEKALGVFIVFYFIFHFVVYTFVGTKWPTIKEYLDALFIHPGNAANASGTREMMAIYPTFVFFISLLPRVRESFKSV